MLRVRVLGGLAIEDGEAPLELPAGTRAAALIGWLALNRGMHERGELAARFWPDVLESSSRASLRSALWSLRASLGNDGEGWLVTTRDHVGLADAVTTDIEEFRSCLEAGRLERAVELGAGELLSGLSDEWVLGAREEHTRALAAALAELALRASRAGEPEVAVAHARRRAALEPLSEDAIRALMRALADAGERSAALAAYGKLRERFRLDWGSARPRRRAAVRDEIRAAAGPAVPGMTSEAGTYPLVGRDRELGELRAAWTQARSGRGGVVLISGEGGHRKDPARAGAGRPRAGHGRPRGVLRRARSRWCPAVRALGGVARRSHARPARTAAGRRLAGRGGAPRPRARAAPRPRAARGRRGA